MASMHHAMMPTLPCMMAITFATRSASAVCHVLLHA
jgi:hypothetical protein